MVFERIRNILLVAAVGVGLSLPVQAAPEEGALLLKVNDLEVSAQAFAQLAKEESRTRFYHFTPPPDEKEAFYRGIIERLIDEKLLSEEAERRGVVPDGDYVMRELVGLERKYQGSAERWSQELPEITAQLNDQAAILALKEAVDASVDPGEDEIRAFYEANRELFVEPPRYRVGLILLAVPPWEREAAWKQAEAEGKALYEALQQGADFAELAQDVSDDPTAQSGGDMGYLHQGMLGDQMQEAVAGLEQVGDVSEPLRVLEGVVIVKLLDREEAHQRSFEEVAERAEKLLVRERQEERWEALKARLREEAEIQVDEALLAEILDQ